MREHFESYWKNYVAAVILGIVIMIVVVAVRKAWTMLVAYSDGCFAAGAALVCMGALDVINYFGGFDMFQYLFAKRDEKGCRVPLYEFAETKKAKRSKRKYGCVAFFVVGAVFILAAALFLI